MCRKPGKLPADTLKESYMKEYGKDTIEIHKDAITEKDVVLLHEVVVVSRFSYRIDRRAVLSMTACTYDTT